MTATTIENVSFKKKISVVYIDGTRKQNLNVHSAVQMTAELEQVKVIVADDEPAARQLLDQFLAESAATLKETVEGYYAVFRAAQAAQAVSMRLPIHTPHLEVPIAHPDKIAAPTDASIFFNAQPTRGYIILGPRDVYTDAQVALKDILRGPFTAIPENYHNKLTQTFMAGKPLGQIKSLFRDFKLYGSAIAPKLREYATLVLNATWPESSEYAKYVAQFRANLLPHNPATFVDGRVDMSYFKLWSLLSFTSS